MTAVHTRLGSDRSPTPPQVFQAVIVITVMVTVVSAATPPSDAVSMSVVAVVIALLGIPHGAVDHLVAAPAVSPGASAEVPRWSPANRQFRFHAGYVAAMLVYAVVWFVVPAFALAGFLVLSIHHFGQSDLAHLRIERKRQLAIQISRGTFLVGVPLVAHLSDVAPVVGRLVGVDLVSWPWLADHTVTWCVALVSQHLVVGLFVAPQVRERSTKVRETLTVAALTALFVKTDPLVGFAVYFGLWHSLNHLHVLAAVLGRRSGSRPMAPIQLARLAAPRTVAALAAVAVFVAGFSATGRLELIVPATVMFVSMLTLPHMVVVERLWRDRAMGSSPGSSSGGVTVGCSANVVDHLAQCPARAADERRDSG